MGSFLKTASRILLISVIFILPCTSKAQEYVSIDAEDAYTTYVMKWYEDLPSVAVKFGVTAEDILKFNGLKSAGEARKKKTLRIPLNKDWDKTASTPAEDGATDAPGQSQKSDPKGLHQEEDGGNCGSEVRMAFIMPFTGEGQSDSYYDFYSGVLMAVRDLGESGIETALSVFDYNEDGEKIQKADLGVFDFILGPVAQEQMLSVLNITPTQTMTVSPLDPKCLTIADTCKHFIQAPTSAERQYEDAVQWLREDLQPGDKVLLLKESLVDATSIESFLQATGIEYKTIQYGILEGRDIQEQMEAYAQGCGTLRAVIASDEEAFVNDAVRNLSLMTFHEINVVLYSASKIRNFGTIEAEALHNVNLHMSTTYFVSYDNSNIKKFLLTYRALFGCEPGPFAYQGYDITSYLVNTRSKYPGVWKHHIENELYRGLQVNYNFERRNGCGFANTAVRRVVYGKDFSIKEDI